ncbi:GNAT family N-acetyltransferase [Rhodovibrionaceae bacterium A322]
MQLQREHPEAFDELFRFMDTHGGDMGRFVVEEPDRFKEHLKEGRVLSTGRDQGVTCVILITQRSLLSEPGRMLFPKIFRTDAPSRPDATQFQIQKALITYCQQQASADPRTLIFHGIEDGSQEEDWLKSLGCYLHRRLLGYAIAPEPGIDQILSELPFVKRAAKRGYEVRQTSQKEVTSRPEIGQRMIDLHNRLFDPRGGGDRIDEEILQRNLSLSVFRHLLLWKGEEIVGLCGCVVEEDGQSVNALYVDEILIDRSHWGSGASDLLGSAAIALAADLGSPRLHCFIEETNHPSRRLVERLGLTEESTEGIYHFRIPASDPRDLLT